MGRLRELFSDHFLITDQEFTGLGQQNGALAYKSTFWPKKGDFLCLLHKLALRKLYGWKALVEAVLTSFERA